MINFNTKLAIFSFKSLLLQMESQIWLNDVIIFVKAALNHLPKRKLWC